MLSCVLGIGTGGTAFNGVVEELKKLTTCVAHVLPVSDDGGSTAEIVRVLGKYFYTYKPIKWTNFHKFLPIPFFFNL